MYGTSDPIGSYAGKPIYCARQELENADAYDLDDSDFAGLANSFHIGLGAKPGRGYLLMAKDDVESLVGNTGYPLEIGIKRDVNLDITSTGSPKYQYISMPNIVYVKATRLYGGNEDDASSLMLVEIADKRIWLNGEIDFEYNVRPMVCNINDNYYPNTVNKTGCTAFIRTDILTDIWAHLPSGQAGTAPHDSDTFVGYTTKAERLQFNCVPALEAYCEVLQRFGMNLGYNPITDTFLIVHPEDVTTAHTTMQTDYRSALIISDKTDFNDYAIVPEKVIVCFTATYASDTQDLHIRPFYRKEYTSSGAGYSVVSNPGTVKYIWGDLDARYDVIDDLACSSATTGYPQENAITLPTPDNQAALDARALELALKYYQYVGPDNIQTRYEYEGCVPFVQNGGAFEISWFNVGNGWITRIERDKNGPFFLEPRRLIDYSIGSVIVQFSIISSGYGYGGPYIGVIEYITNGATAPGLNLDGETIDLYDPVGCYFNEIGPVDGYIGRKGFAHYMEQYHYVIGLRRKWVVMNLCCPPT